MEKTTINVKGMSCCHCVNAITNALSALPGIGSVAVDLGAGAVTVEHDPNVTGEAKIRAEIEDQGYDVIISTNGD